MITLWSSRIPSSLHNGQEQKTEKWTQIDVPHGLPT